MTETSTETDGDILVTIAKQKEALEATKKKGSDAGRQNGFHKRICGGLWIFSGFLMTFFMGPLYSTLCIILFFYLSGLEGLDLLKKSKKKASINTRIFLITHMLYLTVFLYKMP
jgi:hypothetical protein